MRVAGKRRLLILGPSFRRRKDNGYLPALERYDGIFFRIARKYLSDAKDVDVVVMKDDLTLVESDSPLAYTAPIGNEWGRYVLPDEIIEMAKVKNERFLRKKLKNKRYLEIFLAMGKRHASALPDFRKFNVKVIFPSYKGPGTKARALMKWLSK